MELALPTHRDIEVGTPGNSNLILMNYERKVREIMIGKLTDIGISSR
jgi:hypothetical protein